MAALGTLKAKVLIQIADNEPIEVGIMDIDLVAKPQPVKRNVSTVDMNIHVIPSLDAEATAKRVVEQLARLGE